MKKLLQRLFKKPVTWLAERLSSSPKKDQVFTALTGLLKDIRNKKEGSGLTIPLTSQPVSLSSSPMSIKAPVTWRMIFAWLKRIT